MGSITEYLNKIVTAVKGEDVRGAMHDAIKQVYDDAAKSGNANMEVTLARGTEPTLNDRLVKMDEVAETNTAELATKASQLTVDSLRLYFENKINNLLDGSPDGVFDTYSALTTAYPNGIRGVYVVNADGKWYFWLDGIGWTAGGIYQSIKLALNSVTHDELGTTYLTASILSGGIVIDESKTTITVLANTIFATNRKFFNVPSQIILSYASSPNPTYAKNIYADIENQTVVWTEVKSNSKNYAYLGTFYNGRISGASDVDRWTIAGKRNGGLGVNVLNNEIEYKHQRFKGFGYLGYNGKNYVEIDITNKQFRVTNVMNVLYGDNSTINITAQDWATWSEPSNGYVKNVYVDLVENKIKIALNGTSIANPYVILFRFSGNGNEWNKSLWGDKSAAEGLIINNKPPIDGNPTHLGQLGYTSGDIIEISQSNQQVRVLKNFFVFYGANHVSVSVQDWIAFESGTTPSYVLICWYDLDSKRVKVSSHDRFNGLGKNAVFLFRFQGNYRDHYSGNPFNVVIDGTSVKFGEKEGSIDGTDQYDWTTNRFIIPRHLYMVENIEYGFNPQNINFHKYLDSNSLLFEILLPTRTEQFKQYGKISSPIAGVFDTQIVGKYRPNDSLALSKDIRLHIKNILDITQTDINHLYAGDSIVAGALPTTLKYWLDKFGINVNGIGTRNNNYDYGYGVYPKLSNVNGEGIGGARLSDFADTTRYQEGITDKFVSPFLNPDTGLIDFKWYFESRGFPKPDFITFAFLTNDITGYHNKTGAIAESIEDIVNSNIERDYKILIDAVIAYDPTIKIGINPPMTNGFDSNFNQKASRCTEKIIELFEDNPDYPNVYVLSSYLSSAQLAAPAWENTVRTPVNETNKTMTSSFKNNVHQNGMAQLQNTLWVASWILNMLE